MTSFVPSPVLLQDRFAATMRGLCEEAGAQGVRERLMAPLLALLCRRLYLVMQQVSRTLARMQAGSLPVRRRSSGRPQGHGSLASEPGALRLRYGWAWMIRMAPRAAQYAPQVQLLLDDPEMQAALAVSPSLRRAVRPLCRGLAFPTPTVLVETRASRSGVRNAVGSAPVSLAPADGPEAPKAMTRPELTGLQRPVVPVSLSEPPGFHSFQNRHDLPPGRASPRVAPAVLRLFAR